MSGLYVPRREAVELAYYVCEHGQPRSGKIAQTVTEGRDSGRYSSCGDLLACVAFACGHRDYVNRDENRGWKTGRNVSIWNWWTLGKSSPQLKHLKPGDFCVVSTANNWRCHVFIWLGYDEDSGVAHTADYGQPGGKLYHCPMSQSGGKIILRGRPLDFRISLDELSWPEEPVTVGQWLRKHGLNDEDWYETGKVAEDIVPQKQLEDIDEARCKK